MSACKSEIDWADIRKKLPCERTAEQKKQRKILFEAIDSGNGILSLAEIDKGIRDVLKLDAIFNAKPAIMRAFQAAKDKMPSREGGSDDYIEFREFRLFLQYLRQYFEYYVAFERIDDDDDNRISLEEFTNAASKINKETNLKIEDPEKVFKDIDTNGGGFILFDEFFKWAIKNDLDLNDDDD